MREIRFQMRSAAPGEMALGVRRQPVEMRGTFRMIYRVTLLNGWYGCADWFTTPEVAMQVFEETLD